MSDNDLVKDNVVEFPKTTAQEPSEQKIPAQIISSEDVATKATQSQEFVMKLIEKNRKQGLEQVQHKLEVLSNHELLEDPKEENTLRDIMGALQGLTTWAEATSSLLDFVKHDLVAMIQNLQAQGAQSWQAAAHLQTLLTILKEKGLVTEEEMKATWEKMMSRQRQEAKPE